MKKLSLDPDHLDVQSFETVTCDGGVRGTIVGHLDGGEETADGPCATAAYTCGYEETAVDCGPDDPRRIIVYSVTAACDPA